MRQEIITLSSGAVLTAYIWEYSKEINLAKRPAVLVFPGGAYLACSDREADVVALAYAAEGYHTFVLRYRTKRPFEEPFADAREALALIRKNAEKWKVSADKIAICGFSAGGHLAAAMGTIAEEKPNALLLGYPCVREEDWPIGSQIIPRVPGLLDKVSKETPPCFLFAACDDKVVPIQNSISFMDSLNSCGISFECHIFREGGHGFSVAKPYILSGEDTFINRTLSQWFPMSVDWLKGVFGKFETLDAAEDSDVSPALRIPIGEMVKNEKMKEVLDKYHIVSQQMLDMAGSMPLGAMLDFLGRSQEEIEALLKELEEAFHV